MKMKTLLILLVYVHANMFVQAQRIPGFISIDCGVANNYTNTGSSIYYETDEGYADTGINNQVSSDNLGGESEAFWKNMRIFPNGTRNCYTLRPPQGKNNKYMIRAYFFYGDYDSRGTPPSFDVHIDANFWFTFSNENHVINEVIYLLSQEYLQVCLINTGKGVPFISGLDLRLLDKDIYMFDSGALINTERYAVGSPLSYIRYPNDTFDRIWFPVTYSESQSLTNTTEIKIDPNDNPYKVPIVVVETAQVFNKWPAYYYFYSQPNSNDTWYFYLYFFEFQVLEPNQTREFNVDVNGTIVARESPTYLRLITIRSEIMTSQTTGTKVCTISSTAQSTLSPIINAYEKYKVLELPNPMTAQEDFEAINNIRRIYGLVKIKESWQGDPCNPAEYRWSGLSCNDDDAPRIVSLNLSSSGLTGLIAPVFADLTLLQSLDLSNNQLTGEIPNSLAQMQSLQILNLSGNNLKGPVPSDLMKRKADGTLVLSLEGNPRLCNSSHCQPPGSHSTRRDVIVPTVTSLSAFVVVVSLVTVAVIWGYSRKRRDASENHDSSFWISVDASRNNTGTPKIFSHSELQRITSNFQTIIGEGGFGKVYLGGLEDGTQVAVKVLSRTSKQGHKEFQSEAKLLQVVHHRNLVTLIGYCDDPENMALVYEYMSNGNLHDHLSENCSSILSWCERLQIAVDAAQGLEYLHSGCKAPIIHRDFKTANILLDEDMQAKISDFGLSRAFTSIYDTHISTTPAGTPGYLGPEFTSFGNLNKKSDVYSFGIVLFELITGRPALIKDEGKLTHILRWAFPLIDKRDIESIVDPRLKGAFHAASVWKAVEVALSCVRAAASRRPNMSCVLLELKGCMALETASGDSQIMRTSKSSYLFETYLDAGSLNLEMVAPDA